MFIHLSSFLVVAAAVVLHGENYERHPANHYPNWLKFVLYAFRYAPKVVDAHLHKNAHLPLLCGRFNTVILMGISHRRARVLFAIFFFFVSSLRRRRLRQTATSGGVVDCSHHKDHLRLPQPDRDRYTNASKTLEQQGGVVLSVLWFPARNGLRGSAAQQGWSPVNEHQPSFVVSTLRGYYLASPSCAHFAFVVWLYVQWVSTSSFIQQRGRSAPKGRCPHQKGEHRPMSII